MRNLASLDASGLGAKPDLAEGLGAASAALLERLRGVPSVDNVAERSRQPIGHVVWASSPGVITLPTIFTRCHRPVPLMAPVIAVLKRLSKDTGFS